jgi:hypothetical protein
MWVACTLGASGDNLGRRNARIGGPEKLVSGATTL